MKKLSFILFIFIALFSYGCEREVISPNEVDTTPPLPPTGLTVGTAKDGYITITWTRNLERDLYAYIVYRSDGNQNAFRIIDSTQNTYYIDEHLSYDSTYYYYITAIDESHNQSLRSNIVSSKSPNETAPDKPIAFVVHGHHSSYETFMQLEWQPNTESDLAGYNIYRSDQPNVTADIKYFVGKTTRAFFLDSSITKVNYFYYYTITAIDAGGKESLIAEISSDLLTGIPLLIEPAPFGSISTNISFQWYAAAGAQKYKVIVSTSAFTDEISSWFVDPSGNSTESSQYRGPSLAIGQMCYWRVVTFTKSGNYPNAVSETRAFQIVN